MVFEVNFAVGCTHVGLFGVDYLLELRKLCLFGIGLLLM